MVYRVKITAWSDCEGPYFERTISLPFVPSEGDHVGGSTAVPDALVRITSLFWDLREEAFHATVDHPGCFYGSEFEGKSLADLYGPEWSQSG